LNEYLNNLNKSQLKSVVDSNGPSIVIAGAGAGKTRVLTYKIVHLISKGVNPFNILGLTFTNKAAREMKNRIEKIVGSDAKNIWMGTFHSIFAKILRYESELIGYSSNFSIYDTDDSKSLLRRIIKNLNLDIDIYKVNQVQSRISSLKNNLITVNAYNNNFDLKKQDLISKREKIGLIYETYNKECFKADAMDFDDLLLKTNELLHNYPKILHKYQMKFQHILVDEYQDTNHAQYLIIKSLASLNENLFVVGDDAQSIYSFRGANIDNILNFQKDYPDASIFKLEQNYRSTKNIVNAANSIIKNNKNQYFKNVWTDNESGEKIFIKENFNDNEEAINVANSINSIKVQEFSPNLDFAILYRTNAQSRSIEEALNKLNLKYKIFGGLSFYSRKEIKDLMAYFKIVVNQNDEEALRRIINYPKRGIGLTTLNKLSIHANKNQKTIWNIIENIEHEKINLNSNTLNKLINFSDQIKSFKLLSQTKDALETAIIISKESGVLNELKKDMTPEGINRYENIQELINGIRNFVEENKDDLNDNSKVNINSYIEEIALITDVDNFDDEENDFISLMTIHQSKGLEFENIFIVGLEENLFPSQMSMASTSDLEEERRLFYVALTRAKKRISISYALNRFRFGNIIYSEPSRFLKELDEQFIEYKIRSVSNNNFNSVVKLKKKFEKNKLKKIVLEKINYNFRGQQFEIGMKIKHPKFGIGVIYNLDGQGVNKKISVKFREFGEKTLLEQYSNLEIIN
tara:strand:- start:697 stop:2940 length:2244 start_codon:yes stop_codon:yes gene_type:complete